MAVMASESVPHLCNQSMCPTTYKASRTLTKKKYTEIHDAIVNDFDIDVADKIMNIIKEVMKFDVNVNTYTEVQSQRIQKYRDKMKDQGVSTYVSSGRKAALKNKKLQQT